MSSPSSRFANGPNDFAPVQPAISVEQRSVSFFRHRDAQPTLLRSGVARRVGGVRFALRFAHRVHVVEQPGAWAVLRSTLPASCLPALVYCWELCFEQLKKKTQFTLILLVVLVVVGVVGSWLFLLGCFGIHNIYNTSIPPAFG